MTTTTLQRAANSQMQRGGRGSTVSPHWVKSMAEAKQAAHSEDAYIIWIVPHRELADCIAKEVAKRRFGGKAGKVVLLESVRPPLIPVLESRFKKVAFPSSTLPREELKVALQARDRSNRFVGGIVDEPSKIITLWNGDLKPVGVPFDAFMPTANGIHPNFEDFSVTDYGYTLKFGEYEAGADAVLYEYDPQFRRQLKKRRVAEEQTLGASIRRLRMQRQLTRNDFPGIDPKTLARIENGQVRKPHPDTLATIAKRLGVSPGALETF